MTCNTSRTLLRSLNPTRSTRSSLPSVGRSFSRNHVALKEPLTGEPEMNAAQPRTHFGYRDVPESEKSTLVGEVFSSVASSYDIMNDAMSLGIHRLWKDHFVKSLNPHGRLHCLDVAGGTGDIALRILDHARLVHSNRETRVTILDINPEMLAEGKKKVNQSIYYGGDQVHFKLGDAQDLLGSASIPDESMDLYTIAFGIRNCTKVEDVLKEAFRVLRKGGRFCCLEFGKVTNPVIASLYEAYSFRVIPNLGHIVAGDRESYQYLVESIRRFPPQAQFAQMIEDAGFQVPSRKRWEDLSFGVASIHNGIKV